MSVILQPNDRLEVRTYCKDGEQGSVNTVFYRVNAITGTVTDEDCAVAFDSVIAPLIKARIYSGALYPGVTVRVANKLPLPVAALDNTHAGAGTAGAIGLPRQSSGLVDFRTALAGPGGRGRWYMPFPAADDNQAQGIPTNGYVTLMTTFGDALLAVVTIGAVVGGGSADVELVLWSRKFARMTPILATYGSTSWATMKSRGSFGRPNSGPF